MRLFLAILALSAFAADSKPDFSGTWKLVVARSDFGNSPAPDSVYTLIEHREPEIMVHSRVNRLQGAYDSDYRYITDGRENTNLIRGTEIKSFASWEGCMLKVEAHTTSEGAQVEFADQWILSSDRKTLTMIRVIFTPQGKDQQRYVYEK